MVDLSKETLPFVKGEAPRNYTICKDGDVAFADASEDTNDVAKAIEFINCNNEDVICGLHSIHGRDKTKSTIVGYKGYAFASFAFHKQIRRITQGTKIYSIGTKNFNETYVGVPSIEEQTKIARLLFLIDERISTQNKIIEDFKKLMSAIYQNVFYRNEASFVSLGDICSIVKGQQLNGDSLSKNGDYYVMNGGVSPSGYYSAYNNEPNTISISEGGNSCGYVQFNNERFWSSGHCYSLQNLSSDTNPMYLYHYLKYCENSIMKLRIGSGLPNIQKKDLSAFKIFLPNKESQKQLASIFTSIDTKYSVEKILLSEYVNQKLYLLQQMFI